MNATTTALAVEFTEKFKAFADGFFKDPPKQRSVEPVDEDVVSLMYGMFGVDVGHPVMVGTLHGPKPHPGYRVYVIKVDPGNRWNPPEEEDITVVETLYLIDAFKAIANVLAENYINGYFESLPFNEPEPMEE